MTDDHRPCICGAFWGLDMAEEHFVTCLCGEELYVQPDDGEWFVQHGLNPEHRSPNFKGGSLLAACDWVDAVCLSQRDEASDD